MVNYDLPLEMKASLEGDIDTIHWLNDGLLLGTVAQH